MKCGELEHYVKAYDRVNIKNEVPLAMVNRIFHKVTTTDDPVIRKVSMLSLVLDLLFYLFFKYKHNFFRFCQKAMFLPQMLSFQR